MGVPFFGIILERNIALVCLYVIIVVEVLEGDLLAVVVILSDTSEHFLVECTFLIVEGIAAQGLALEIHGYFLQQLVGGGEDGDFLYGFDGENLVFKGQIDEIITKSSGEKITVKITARSMAIHPFY